MNPTPATPNAEPPVTLVVGAGELEPGPGADNGDGDASAQVVVHVDDYLQAMGEMAHRRVGAIVGRVGPMRANMDATVQALRQTAPGARLVIVAEPADEPDAMRAVRLGFDDYLIEPVSPQRWSAALARGSGGPSTPPRASQAEPATAAAPAPQPAGPHERPADDLILDQLLKDRGSIRETIVATIRASVGADVTVLAEPDLDARGCVPITYRTTPLGFLVSDSVTDRRLIAWVDWAGKWLALEQRINELRHMAWHDELTGVWNRRYFMQFLESVLRRAREQRFRVTLLLFDLDDFKQYNDAYGHDAGDEILREAARLMVSVVRRHDVVARIGGDEFAVIFWDADAPRREQSEHPHSPQRAAARFQRAICDHRFPKLADLAPGTLTISGGLASFPWDGQTLNELMTKADEMLLSSKGQGKNVITLGPGALYVCGEGGGEPVDPPPRATDEPGD